MTVLRDTGCSGVVVKKKFVKDCQYTGRHGFMTLIDKTIRKAPIARINIDTPYFTGEVDALCLPDAIYDVFIGNIDGARLPNELRQERKIETSAASDNDTSSDNDDVCASLIDDNNMEGLDFQTFNICNVVTRSDTQFGKELSTRNIQDSENIGSKSYEVSRSEPKNATSAGHKIHLTSNIPNVANPYPFLSKNKEKLKNFRMDKFKSPD